MIYAVVLSAALSWLFAQADPSTEKYQPAIRAATACVLINEPTAYIEGIRAIDDAYAYLLLRCLPKFRADLARLGAESSADGGFRNIIREEWPAFMERMGYRQ